MTTTVGVRHHFDTAHRLPQLGGKCANVHGHTWHVHVSITGQPDEQHGIVVDFGPLKTNLREWIDTHLDHGIMLGARDPLVPALVEHDCRLVQFGKHPHTDGLDWPTVENVATLLYRVATSVLADHGWRNLTVTEVALTETVSNTAEVHP